jgi:hypothetical protein
MNLIDSYKHVVLRLSEDDMYNHFTDGMEYFRNKDNQCFLFLQEARAIVKNGERENSPTHIRNRDIWHTARSNLLSSFEFTKFVENIINRTNVETDLR